MSTGYYIRKNKKPRETRICPVDENPFECKVTSTQKCCCKKCAGIFKRGKSSWNKNLTKETDNRVLKSAENCSATLKKKYDSGEIKTWNDGLTKDTDERIKRKSECMLGDGNPMKRKGAKEKSSKSHTGKTFIIERKNEMSKNAKKNGYGKWMIGRPSVNKGIPRTQESIDKQKETNRKKRELRGIVDRSNYGFSKAMNFWMPGYVRHHNTESGEYYWIRKDIHLMCGYGRNSEEHKRRVLRCFYNSVENMINGVIDYAFVYNNDKNKWKNI